jgi:SAM-dependent methyltransferase
MRSEYDDFAWFYARYWNRQYHAAAFPILQRILLSRLRKGAQILDVCCGTGTLARLLCDRGFRVTGIDVSAKMIRQARRHAPAAEFLVLPADRLDLPPRFSAAVSTFDSLNHILELDTLHQAFSNVRRALRPGGCFVFDVLFEEAYRIHWAETHATIHDDHVLAISGEGYDPINRIARCRVTMFRRTGGLWRRSDTEITEKCYTHAEIDEALQRSGFDGISCYDARDLGWPGNSAAVASFIPPRLKSRRRASVLPVSDRARRFSAASPSSVLYTGPSFHLLPGPRG